MSMQSGSAGRNREGFVARALSFRLTFLEVVIFAGGILTAGMMGVASGGVLPT